MPEEPRDPELTALENALGTLRPRSQLDCNRLMYQAGRQSARWRWLGPATVAALAAAFLTLVTTLAVRPAPQTIDRIVYVPAQTVPALPDTVSPVAEQPAASSQTALNYFQLEDRLFRLGLDGLPPLASEQLPDTGDPLLAPLGYPLPQSRRPGL